MVTYWGGAAGTLENHAAYEYQVPDSRLDKSSRSRPNVFSSVARDFEFKNIVNSKNLGSRGADFLEPQ
jgi:hypothetical protein